MRRLRIQNPILSKAYRTYLTADYSSGTSVTVASVTSFAALDQLVFGEPREELTELKQLTTTVATTTLTLPSALNFAHNKGTPVYKTPWNFVEIERRTSSSGSFSVISQSPIQWDNKNNETVYYDSAGTSSYGYRFRFYNSATSTYSEYSPTIDGAAPARNVVRYMVARVRKITGDEERKIVSDDEIIRAFNKGQDIIYAHNSKYWFLYVDTFELGSGSISATAGEDTYTLNNLTNFGHLDSLRYRYSSGSTDNLYHLEEISSVEFDHLDADQNTTDDNWPTVYKRLPGDATSDNGYIKVTPDIKDSSIGIFYPNYYEKMADLDSMDDETQVPLPHLLEDYAIGWVEKIKGNENKGNQYLSVLEIISTNDNQKTLPQSSPRGLLILDAMDEAQRKATGQPMYLSRFRGHRAQRRLYGNKTLQSPDYIRENYF
jgi:hypothetical protein